MIKKKTNIIIRKRNIWIKILFALILLGKGEGFADEDKSVYTIHPPHLSIPSGDPGETRRIIMQFYHWTLICDEKQKFKQGVKQSIKQGICNVTQTVRDEKDNTIFSWSLASTKNGQAVMLFRALPNADTNFPIRMFVEGIKKPVLIDYRQCNQMVCLGQSPVGPILSKQIEQGKEVRISYKLKEGKTFSFIVPFKGLSAALYSLQR
ncbi:invasion associated locus B family protein [Bartonella doshiae]|uniref:invasion associated locus B family protein n=1 Tax=Bartonella doshiae TaxID=33044 RepID=UPI000942AE4E|nr:invasion associated locus B family protein [Bartonella doshiae]